MVFIVSEELCICFDEELALNLASKRILVRLRDEWSSAPRERAHDLEPLALD